MKKMDLGQASHSRPTTRLFLLTSVDGKISTGKRDRFDFDQDIPKLLGEVGISQYYNLEKQTDSWTLCSGKTMEKISDQLIRWSGPTVPVTLVVCTNSGLRYDTYLALRNKYRHVIIATSNLKRIQSGADTLLYEEHNLVQLLENLRARGCHNLTIQSGGELNAAFLRAGLIDVVEVVMAPILVGGSNTPTLIDGPEVKSLSEVATLSLSRVEGLKDGYLYMRYTVKH